MVKEIRDDVTVAPITNELRETAILEEWFENHAENWILGFGKGDIGSVRAVESFKVNERKSEDSESFALLGVYKEGLPVGYCTLESLGDDYRTVNLFIYLSPTARQQGIGEAALQILLSQVFYRPEIHRVQVQILSINKEAIGFFRKMGFTQEGVKKEAYWMGINSFNVVLLRLLRPEWKRA